VKNGRSAPSGSKAKTSGEKDIFGSTFIVDQSIEPPTVDVEYPHIYRSYFIYREKSFISRFNGLWPSVSVLREWVNKTWSPGHDFLFCTKRFFIVNISIEADYQCMLEQRPWFWERSGLSM
jgi:hypothetical protein